MQIHLMITGVLSKEEFQMDDKNKELSPEMEEELSNGKGEDEE